MSSILRAVLFSALSSLFLVISGCGGGGSQGSQTLTQLQIDPQGATVPAGTQQQFRATAIFSDGNKLDVTSTATWQSSNTTVATINGGGLAQALATGSTQINASYNGKMASTSLTVSAAVATALAVTPVNPSIAKGSTQQFTATATFSDNTTADVTGMSEWASDNAAVATVGNGGTGAGKGLASGVAIGSAGIGARYAGLSASTMLTVTPATVSSLQVTPSAPSIAKGTTQQFTATAVFTDGTTQDFTKTVTWASSNTAVSTISNGNAGGLATGAAKGSSTISASKGGVTGSTTLTVTDATLTALAVSPTTPSVAKGLSQQFTATGTYTDGSTQDVTASAVWSSSDTTVATISNATGSSGLAQTRATGTTTIAAALSGKSSNTVLTVTAATLSRIDVTPANSSVPNGTTQQFTATGVYTDGTTQDFTTAATWASDATAVLEVSNSSGSKGLGAAKSVGSANVSAAYQSITGSTPVTVSAATVSSLQITPANGKLAKGFSQQYTATAIYSDNSNRDVTSSATWASSNTSAATVSNASGSNGLVTATATPGSTAISASFGGVNSSTALTVTNATLTSVAISPASPSLPAGTTQQLAATGTFSDSTKQDLTTQASWTSSSTAVATVGSSAGSYGLAKGVSQGSSTITASVSNATTTTAVAGNTTLTVSAATLKSVVVTPDTASIAKGTTQQYKATGTYSDNTTRDLAGDSNLSWTTGDTNVATIVASGTGAGVATGAGVGKTSIKAAYAVSGSTIAGTAAIEVTAATLSSLAVTPTPVTIPNGTTQQFKATGTYSDNSTKDLTTTVTWTSDNTSVATVSNASPSQGLASGVSVGSANIKAASGSLTAVAALTVSNAVATSLAVTPASATIAVGTSLQFTATETFSDGSTKDVTNAATWSVSDTAKAAISSTGQVTAKATGTVTVQAVDSSTGKSGSVTLNISPAQLQSISVSCKSCAANSTAVPAGYKAQFVAAGLYSDGSTKDLTTDSSTSWSVLNTAVATVDSSTSKGLVTGVTAGSTTLIAKNGSVQGTATVTVNAVTLSSIAITPTSVTLKNSGDTQQYTAIGTFSDNSTLDITNNGNGTAWSTGSQTQSQSVAINATTGLATAGNVPGNASITANKAGVISNTSTATYNPAPTVPVGP